MGGEDRRHGDVVIIESTGLDGVRVQEPKVSSLANGRSDRMLSTPVRSRARGGELRPPLLLGQRTREEHLVLFDGIRTGPKAVPISPGRFSY